jgi:hypothetical protein
MKNISALYVAVDHCAAMSVMKGIAHLCNDAKSFGEAEPTTTDEAVKRNAFEAFHNHIQIPFLLTNIVNLHDMKVIFGSLSVVAQELSYNHLPISDT